MYISFTIPRFKTLGISFEPSAVCFSIRVLGVHDVGILLVPKQMKLFKTSQI